MNAPNLLNDIPDHVLSEEVVGDLLKTKNFRIERIISHGHSSPPGFWYDQAEAEWVLLISGQARLRFEGQEPIEMSPGSYIKIPAHQRHRVEWTAPDQPAVWLAIHYSDLANDASQL